MTPTSRTLQKLKQLGFTAAVVERWIPQMRRRLDVYGFADILACYPGFGVLLIQCTSGTNHAARRTKILAEPKAAAWLESGGRIECWSWAKRGARGKRKTWELRREELTVDMFTAAPADIA